MLGTPTTRLAAATLATVLSLLPISTLRAEGISFTTSSRTALSFFKAGIELDNNLYQEAAAEQFKMAIELDPRFASAYLYLARSSGTYAEYRRNLDRAISLLEEVSEGERLLIKSYEARDENRPADEERILRRLAALFPDEVDTHYHLAEVYFANADYEHAIHKLEHAITIDDEYPPAYNLLGYCHAYLGQFEDAIATLRMYASLIPDEPNPHDLLGEILLMAGRFEESIDEYTAALDIDPTFYSAYAGRGHCYLFQGDAVGARAEYARMLDIAPNDVVRRDARRWQAVADLFENKLSASIVKLKDIQQTSLAQAEVLSACNRALDIAWVGDAEGKFDEVRVELESGWQTMMTSDLPEAAKKSYARRHHVVSGICAANAGDLAGAHTKVDQVRRLVEQSEDLNDWQDYNWLMGEILLEEGDYRGAISNLLQAPPENVRVLLKLSEAHRHRGAKDQAAHYLERVRTFNRPGVLYALARRTAEQTID